MFFLSLFWRKELFNYAKLLDELTGCTSLMGCFHDFNCLNKVKRNYEAIHIYKDYSMPKCELFWLMSQNFFKFCCLIMLESCYNKPKRWPWKEDSSSSYVSLKFQNLLGCCLTRLSLKTCSSVEPWQNFWFFWIFIPSVFECILCLLIMFCNWVDTTKEEVKIKITAKRPFKFLKKKRSLCTIFCSIKCHNIIFPKRN